MKIHFFIYLTNIKYLWYNVNRMKSNHNALSPTGTASVFPCFCSIPLMPLNIPSVDLTRSQGYDNGDLEFQRPPEKPWLTTHIRQMTTGTLSGLHDPEKEIVRMMITFLLFFGLATLLVVGGVRVSLHLHTHYISTGRRLILNCVLIYNTKMRE